MHGFWNEIIKFVLLTAAPLKHLGVFGYPAVFLIAFAECLIIIGFFIPGSVGIIFAGFLAARGYYSFWPMLLFASLGGILGDYSSFYLGGKGEHFFKDEARFLKKAHLEKGKKFFEKYGDKSILIGRFTGTFRSVVPFIAGLSKMDKKNFFIWNVVSALIWVFFHMALGYFFATSLKSIESWSLFVGAGLLVVIGVIAVVAIAIERREKIFGFLDRKTNAFLKMFLESTYIAAFLEKHPKVESFITARFRRHIFTGLPLTVLTVLFCYLVLLFAGVAQSFVYLAPVANVDERVLNLAVHFYHPHLVPWVVALTRLGGEVFIPVLAALVVIILLLQNNKRFIAPFLFTGVVAEIFNLVGKHFFERIRPAAMLVKETSYSFPSGHATLAIAVYGFIAYMIMRLAKTERVKSWSVVCLGLLIFLISFSRLYLRVHYFSDVLGGFLLGGLCLVAGIALSEYFLTRNK